MHLRTTLWTLVGSLVLGGCSQERGHDMLTAPSVDASGNPISMASPKAEERGEEPPGGWTFEPSAPEDCANGVDDDADNRSDCGPDLRSNVRSDGRSHSVSECDADRGRPGNVDFV